MDTIETLKKKMESMALFDIQAGGESPILKLVQVGRANKIVTEEQATIFSCLKFFFIGEGFADWGPEFVDMLEEYQATCGVPTAETNSRVMLQSVLQWQEAMDYNRNRSSLNIGLDGGKK